MTSPAPEHPPLMDGEGMATTNNNPEGISQDVMTQAAKGTTSLPIYIPRKRCEVCVTVLMRRMSQGPHLCSGLEHYFETVSFMLSHLNHDSCFL